MKKTTTNRIKNFPAQRIVIALVLIIIVSLLVQHYIATTPHFAKPVGNLKTITNEILSSNINTYMESQKSPYALGKENYHCSNTLYGFDDKYAYAWVNCSGYIVNDKKEQEQGSAFSVPTRLEYKAPGFQVISFKQPGSGSLYTSTFQQLFPEVFYKLARKDTSH
jgi:hypothetical protein